MTQHADDAARRARAVKYGSNVILGTILVVVILAAANFLAAKSQKRLDLTRGKHYTISEGTTKLLSSLQDNVVVKVYATRKDTPADWTRQRDELKNLLYEYRLKSHGKLQYSFIDPEPESKEEKEAQQVGIREQQMQRASTTDISIKVGYLGFTVGYKAKNEVVPVIRPESSLEYQLTRAINKVAQVDLPVVGVIAPGGNPMMGEQGGQFSLVNELLEQEAYTVKNLEPNNLRDLKDVKLIMVLDPEELSEEALYRLDQYVMKGGKLFVATQGVQVQQGPRGEMRGTPKSPNINSLLENYGVRINSDIIEDWERGTNQNFLTQRGIVSSKNPFLMMATDLSSDSVITKNLPPMAFVYPSSVSMSDKGTSGVVDVLIKTSSHSKKQEGYYILDQTRVKRPTAADKLDSYNLVVSVKGPLSSRFASVDPPALTQDDGTTRPVNASEVKKVSEPGAQVIVASSGLSFINEIISRASPVNAIFLLNVADSMTRGGEIIALRSKQQSTAVLKEGITEGQALTAQVLVLSIIPLLVVAFGFVKMTLNRMRRNRYISIYGRTAP